MTTQENVEEPTCNCPRFGDTGGYRIADLTCPIHGVSGTDPGDGMWNATSENVEQRDSDWPAPIPGFDCIHGPSCQWCPPPENVEEPCLTCRALGVAVFDPDYFCPTCSTPTENVECRTCRDTGMVQTRRWEDWDVADCPDCTTPENVEEPTVTDRAVRDGGS